MNENPLTNQGNMSTYCPPANKIKIKTLNFTQKDYVFYLVFLVLSVLLAFSGLFFGGIGITVTSVLFIVSMFAYLFEKHSINFSSVSAIVLAFANSFVFFLYGNDHLTRFIAMMLIMASGIIYTASMRDKIVLDNFDGAVKLAYGSLVSPLENIAVPIRSVAGNDKKKITLQVLGAIGLAIPALAVIIPLLVSSDVAFEGLVNKIISTLGNGVAKTILGIVIFFIVSSYAVTCKFGLSNKVKGKITLPKGFIKIPFAVTFLGILSVVYLVYMFSQTAYFFSAFSGILPKGYEISFANYARRGFFETEAIAFINLIIMMLFMWLTVKNEHGKLSKILKGFLTFISAFSVLFIITAISKMFMYIGEYGLTVLRMGTSVFMLATGIVILAFVIRVFNPNLKTMKYALIISMAMFTALALCGLDRTVASFNVNRYLSGKTQEIDISMLKYMSDSSTPYIVKLIDCKDESVSERAKYAIQVKYMRELREVWYKDDDAIIRVNAPKGLDFTLSGYREEQAVNSVNVNAFENYYEYEEDYLYDEEPSVSGEQYAEETELDWDTYFEGIDE